MSFEFEQEQSEIYANIVDLGEQAKNLWELSTLYAPIMVDKTRDVLYRTFDFNDMDKTIDLIFPIVSVLFLSVGIFFILKEREFKHGGSGEKDA